MSKHKYTDRICAIVLVAALILTVLFINGERLGITAEAYPPGYEDRIFDTTRVHSIDLIMDDWDTFIENATSEEYALCAVVIDGEAYRNVAIRAKGNTSLSTVAQLDSDRYSFKIEFDHYDSSKTYHGLDKLCLNNLIQDATFMKDYLTYRLMDAFGADAPLCSYAYLTVNGEDWGLYLAVEAVEDSFITRNYGADSGNLYKPDSQNMGGGRGAGRDFDLDEAMQKWAERQDADGETDAEEERQRPQGGPEGSFDGRQGGPGGFGRPGSDDEERDDRFGRPDGSGEEQDGGFGRPDGSDEEQTGGFGGPGGNFGGPGGGGFGGGMGSDDVKLKYVDEDLTSYSNIFDSAKTDITEEDEERLVASLKTLSEYVGARAESEEAEGTSEAGSDETEGASQAESDESETDPQEATDLAAVVNVDEVLRYFVVHNYVVNGDSYTGSMIHNYYLYEDNGQLSMIPWDYNLAYGCFQELDASTSVNDPIDTPLSVSGDGDRPMADWFLVDDAYTELYHQYMQEFLNTVDIQGIIDEAAVLIDPYVEKDPTKFFTYEEFQTGVEALKTFIELRSASVRGQLNGTIPSTDEEQSANSSTLVDASSLDLSDLGSMHMGDQRGGGPRGPSGE